MATLSAADLAWFESSGIDPTDPLWAGFVPTAHPGYQQFQDQAAIYTPIMAATTVDDWLRAVQAIPNPSDGERALFAKVRDNPDGYEIRGGTAWEKPNYIERNIWWIAPTALVGGSALAAFIAGPSTGAAAAAGTVLPSSAMPAGWGASTLPAALASPGIGATSGGLLASSVMPAGWGASILPAALESPGIGATSGGLLVSSAMPAGWGASTLPAALESPGIGAVSGALATTGAGLSGLAQRLVQGATQAAGAIRAAVTGQAAPGAAVTTASMAGGGSSSQSLLLGAAALVAVAVIARQSKG